MEAKPLPVEAAATLQTFEAALDDLESKAEPFLRADVDQLAPHMSAVANAKLNFSLAYAMNSLFYMFLKTQGVVPDDHPVKAELDRIKTYHRKIRAAEGESVKRGDGASSAAVRVDTDAARRIVAAHTTQRVDGSKKRKSPADETKNKKEKRRKRKKKNKSP